MDSCEKDSSDDDPFVADLLATALDTVSLVTNKRKAYGNSFGKVSQIMTILYPDGVPPSAYSDALATIRILDKIVRLANSKGQTDPMSENPWSDILGYALLSVASQDNSQGSHNE